VFGIEFVFWVRICWWESWIVASCIFVLDLDPPKLRVRPPIEGFRLGPRFLVGFGGDSILGDLGCLRTQVLGHSIP
jgi:hypothetical protein